MPGKISVSLDREGGTAGVFATGMVAAFSINTFDWNKARRGHMPRAEEQFNAIADLARQNVAFVVTAQGYEIAVIDLGSFTDRVKIRLNSYIWWLNLKLQREVGRNEFDQPMIKFPFTPFETATRGVQNFVSAANELSKESSRIAG